MSVALSARPRLAGPVELSPGIAGTGIADGRNTGGAHMYSDDDTIDYKVFGYYTSFDEGPVRQLGTGYLGRSALLHDAESLMREADYPYEFYAIEYADRGGTYSRYYDAHGHFRFESHRSASPIVRTELASRAQTRGQSPDQQHRGDHYQDRDQEGDSEQDAGQNAHQPQASGTRH